MIGQKNLIKEVVSQIDADTFPHFCIFTGAAGSGKKTFINKIIIPRINAQMYNVEVNVDGVRNMIRDAYTINNRIVYVIADADKLSTAGKNALLKLTEEPPNQAYIIMTLSDINNTLDTIKSRSVVFNMEKYTQDEIFEYFWTANESGNPNDAEIARELCETPGDVDVLISQNCMEFYDYVQLAVDNIADVSDANSFKLGSKIQLKSDGTGYDLKMFLKAFMLVCLSRLNQYPMKYSAGISITSAALRDLDIRGISKSMLLDSWIMNIRHAWNNISDKEKAI